MAVPSSEDILPVFDLSSLSENVDSDTPLTDEQQHLCTRLAECLRATGCLVVSETRSSSTDLLSLVCTIAGELAKFIKAVEGSCCSQR